MRHFNYLWLQMSSWFTHLFMGNHTELEGKIAEDVADKVVNRIDKTLTDKVDPLIRSQMQTEQLTKAVVDALRQNGIPVRVPPKGFTVINGNKSPGDSVAN